MEDRGSYPDGDGASLAIAEAVVNRGQASGSQGPKGIVPVMWVSEIAALPIRLQQKRKKLPGKLERRNTVNY